MNESADEGSREVDSSIAEAVKVSESFVHKACKNAGPQTLEIPACQN